MLNLIDQWVSVTHSFVMEYDGVFSLDAVYPFKLDNYLVHASGFNFIILCGIPMSGGKLKKW